MALIAPQVWHMAAPLYIYTFTSIHTFLAAKDYPLPPFSTPTILEKMQDERKMDVRYYLYFQINFCLFLLLAEKKAPAPFLQYVDPYCVDSSVHRRCWSSTGHT